MSLTAAAYLAAAADLPLLDPAHLPFRRAVVVAPHPDDESLGCGTLLAALAASNGAARVVFLTDGGASHPDSRAWPRQRLAALRRAEALAALTDLGHAAEAALFLDLPDAEAPALGEPGFAGAVAAVAAAAEAIDAEALAVTWRHDPHRDHEAAHAIARGAAGGRRLLEYPIWGWNLPAETVVAEAPPRGFRLDPTPHATAKRRAVGRHRSQLGLVVADDPGGFALDPPTLARFEGPEIFLEAP